MFSADFQNYCEIEDIEQVKIGLKDPNIDPSERKKYAIRYARSHGRLEVVKLLLDDKRVDPSADKNWAIRFASENGYTEIVNILLDDIAGLNEAIIILENFI